MQKSGRIYNFLGTFLIRLNIYVAVNVRLENRMLRKDLLLVREGSSMRFYTVKLPRFLGGIVKAIIGMKGKK